MSSPRRPRPRAPLRSSASACRGALPAGAVFVKVGNARRALALAAARFYPRQPATIAAVTGTSGKTSVAAFTRQIWAALGHQAASVGTIGVVTPKREVYGSLTTPDPVALHRTLSELAAEGVTHLAIEASSHGLDQHRLDGVRVAAGGFTNLSRDHLDYHPSIEAYLAAKLRLFEALVVDGGGAVIDVDHEHSGAVVAAARKRGLKLMTVGRKGDGIRLLDSSIDGLHASDDRRTCRQALSSAIAAGRRLPDRECAGRGGPRHRDRRRGGSRLRRACFAQGRQGPARSGRSPQRRAGIRRLRPQARRAGEGDRGAAALRQARARRRVRLPAATATRASGR